MTRLALIEFEKRDVPSSTLLNFESASLNNSETSNPQLELLAINETNTNDSANGTLDLIGSISTYNSVVESDSSSDFSYAIEFSKALSNALSTYTNGMINSLLASDQLNEDNENSSSFLSYNCSLSFKNPLSEAELTELHDLVKTTSPSEDEKNRRDSLLGRLKQDGIKFDGTSELETLGDILEAGKTMLDGDARADFLDLYCTGLELAVDGLQNIDNERYGQYKRARDGGASHDEAWTFANGGETALRRYELEKLIENASH